MNWKIKFSSYLDNGRMLNWLTTEQKTEVFIYRAKNRSTETIMITPKQDTSEEQIKWTLYAQNMVYSQGLLMDI